MASSGYELRYSDDVKRYGLYATQEILAGTKILQEGAVVADVGKIRNILNWSKQNNTADKILSEAMRSDLRTETQKLLDGMTDLKECVKDNEKYDTTMEIHKKRMDNGSIYNYDDDGNTLIHPYPELSMQLYKQAIVTTGPATEEVFTAVLQHPLRQINTYLHGIVEVQYPDSQAWGPTTSLINHGCSPNAIVSCFAEPDPAEKSLRNVGAVALYATKTIEAGEEITIEYFPVFGTLKHRRAFLRSYGIQKCLCRTCEHEEELSQQSTRTDGASAKEQLRNLMHLNLGLHVFFTHTITNLPTYTPAKFFHCLHTVLTSLHTANMHGSVAMTRLYIDAIDFAKHHNDNVRIYWMTQQLLGRIRNAYGPSHPMLQYYVENYHYATLDNVVWNEGNRDLLSLVQPWTLGQEDIDLVFMLSRPASSPSYQQLVVTPGGRLEAVSYAENLLRVRSVFAVAAAAGADEEEEETEKEEEEEEAAAGVAALALVVSEDKEAEKKARAKAKKKEKEQRRKERKRAAAAAATTAEEEEEGEREEEEVKEEEEQEEEAREEKQERVEFVGWYLGAKVG